MAVMRIICLLGIAGLVAACGADGDPTPPFKAVTPVVSLTGDASIGVSGEL